MVENNSKVLIAGASGYIGAKLSLELSKKGVHVSALCRTEPIQNDQWSNKIKKIIVGDITDNRTLDKIKEENYDTIINLISIDHNKSKKNPQLVSSINTLPNWLFLDHFSKKNLKSFIYLSTIHVYGENKSDIIFEDDIPSPSSYYALSHYLSENVCNYFNKNSPIRCYNIRLSNCFGGPLLNNKCWTLVLNNFCRSIYEKKIIDIRSDGSPLRDCIYIDNVIHGIEILMNQKRKHIKNTFNLASGKYFSIVELAFLVQKIYSRKFKNKSNIILNQEKISEIPKKIKSLNKNKISIKKIQKAGYREIVALEQGINKLFSYLELR